MRRGAREPEGRRWERRDGDRSKMAILRNSDCGERLTGDEMLLCWISGLAGCAGLKGRAAAPMALVMGRQQRTAVAALLRLLSPTE